ncbi:hypothetical protein KR018_004784 [Drosophila ironensis]|nr:hypothetical protein KR018_004784 [Drosophila ironensis]
MSYLLTEIALEMLGYKFYDTNGVFHLTNFQNNTAQAETQPDEPLLSDFIEQLNPDEEIQPKPDEAVAEKEAQKHISHQDYSLEKSVLGRGETKTHAPRQRRAPAKALAKIMNYESDKIVGQISSRLEGTLGRCQDEEEVEVELEMERRRMTDDAAEMRQFREFLQERVQQLDGQPYEKYLQTFGAD